MLEIVRGRDIGRRYPVAASETTIGNALAGEWVRSSDQEANSPRGWPAGMPVSFKNEGLLSRGPGEPGRHVREPAAAARRPTASALQPGDIFSLAACSLRSNVKTSRAKEDNATAADSRALRLHLGQGQVRGACHPVHDHGRLDLTTGTIFCPWQPAPDRNRSR